MATSNGRDRITGLPAELCLTIAEYNTKDDLKNLRVVSKSWNEIGSRLLFTNLTVRMHMTPAEWAERINPTICASVKTLCVTTIEFGDMDDAEYQVWLDDEFGLDLCDPQHLQQAIATYKQFREVHLEMLAAGQCLAYLTELLNNMTNLEKVKLTGDFRAVFPNWLEISYDRHPASSVSTLNSQAFPPVDLR
ncbi:MAG: hypothetical protein Q9226_006855 [Calogaya cf. arnoldii]